MKNSINIGFIGAGNMAYAIICGMLDNNFRKQNIKISDINEKLLITRHNELGLDTFTNNTLLAKECQVIILAIKPQTLALVCKQLKKFINTKHTIISIVAGAKITDINNWLGMNISVIRAMPNTPAMIKQSSIGLMANKITSNEQKQLTEKILSSVGTCLWVEQESMLDAITALSGSGPAYFFFMIEAMTKAGIELGLDEEIARKFSIKTALGASMMADKSKYTPSQLRANVTSEKGVTESAIESLKKQNFEQIIANMMRVGFIRAQEIGFELGNND